VHEFALAMGDSWAGRASRLHLRQDGMAPMEAWPSDTWARRVNILNEQRKSATTWRSQRDELDGLEQAEGGGSRGMLEHAQHPPHDRHTRYTFGSHLHVEAGGTKVSDVALAAQVAYESQRAREEAKAWAEEHRRRRAQFESQILSRAAVTAVAMEAGGDGATTANDHCALDAAPHAREREEQQQQPQEETGGRGEGDGESENENDDLIAELLHTVATATSAQHEASAVPRTTTNDRTRRLRRQPPGDHATENDRRQSPARARLPRTHSLSPSQSRSPPRSQRSRSQPPVQSKEERMKVALAALDATRAALREKEARMRAAKADRLARESEREDEGETENQGAYNPSVILNEVIRGKGQSYAAKDAPVAAAAAAQASSTRPEAWAVAPRVPVQPDPFAAARRTFVEQALAYVGCDYDTIDCCGLVRICVHALPGIFHGFRLDRCNQGVMLDTLRHGVISDPRQLQLGDLIFYCADYRDPKKKPKRHRCVHVEIYLGKEGADYGRARAATTARALEEDDGIEEGCLVERSIGSRSSWHYDHAPIGLDDPLRSRLVREMVALRAKEEERAGLAGVQVYSSFKTRSERWSGPVQIHFRSLAPWLRGEGALPPEVASHLGAKPQQATGKAKLRARIAQMSLGAWAVDCAGVSTTSR